MVAFGSVTFGSGGGARLLPDVQVIDKDFDRKRQFRIDNRLFLGVVNTVKLSPVLPGADVIAALFGISVAGVQVGPCLDPAAAFSGRAFGGIESIVKAVADVQTNVPVGLQEGADLHVGLGISAFYGAIFIQSSSLVRVPDEIVHQGASSNLALIALEAVDHDVDEA